MIFYLAHDEHKDEFEELKESEALTIEVRANLLKEDIIRFLKKDLRNIEIKCLIIDCKIFDIDGDTYDDIKEILEVFYILNSDSRCILYTDKEVLKQLPPDIEGSLLIQQYEKIHIDKVSDFINGREMVETVQQVATGKIDSEEEEVIADTLPPEKKINTIVDNGDIEIKQTTIPKKVTKRKKILQTKKAMPQDSGVTPENRKNVMEQFLPADITYAAKTIPDQIYTVASQPNKISEGIPLKKRIQQAKEEQIEVPPVDDNVVDINRYSPGQKQIRDKKWGCSNIIIGVVGTERKVGTTTACIKLALQLSGLGAAVSYSEANAHNHLDMLAKEFKLHLVDDHYLFHSIRMYSNSSFDFDAGMNFILLDLGCMADNDQRINRIIQEMAAHVIVVSGKRGYEQKALLYTMSLLPEKDVSILFNFTQDEELKSLGNKYRDLVHKVSSVPYHPDLNQTGIWDEDYLSTFDKYRTDKKNTMKSQVNR